jgi:hypothetical protein
MFHGFEICIHFYNVYGVQYIRSLLDVHAFILGHSKLNSFRVNLPKPDPNLPCIFTNPCHNVPNALTSLKTSPLKDDPCTHIPQQNNDQHPG